MIKTVSLETAKLLKKEGFPQETSLFYRVDEYGNVFERSANADPLKMQKVLGTNLYYAKPTTDELLEELPYAVNINRGRFEYRVSYHIVSKVDNINFLDKNLCEALAQMWLWLKKEGLL